MSSGETYAVVPCSPRPSGQPGVERLAPELNPHQASRQQSRALTARRSGQS